MYPGQYRSPPLLIFLSHDGYPYYGDYTIIMNLDINKPEVIIQQG